MEARQGTALLLWLSILDPVSLAWTHPDVAATGASVKAVTVPMSLTQWISLIFSRGIYSILACLITLCVIYTVLKNKFGRSRQPGEYSNLSSESSKWLDAICKTTGSNQFSGCSSSIAVRRYSFSTLLGRHEVDEEPKYDLEDKLRTFETEVSTLRGELEISNKSRLELESSMEILDRDKMTTEERLESEKFLGSVELEQLREENKNAQRELQKVLTEKADLGREVESLQREARIAEAALRDQVSLQGRLEEARAEVEALKAQMESLKHEKEVAVTLVAEIMNKAARRTPSLAVPLPDSLSQFEDPDILMMVGDAVGETLSHDSDLDDPKIEDMMLQDECSSDERNDMEMTPEENEMWLRRRKGTSQSEDSEEALLMDGAGDENRPLTNSTLFRKFLQNNFS